MQQSGNIGQLLWQVKGRTTQAYGLSYDYLDRLTGAQSSEYDASNALVNSNYFQESQSFDVRGNLTSQQRSGLVKGASSYSKASLDGPSLAQVSGTNQTTTATGSSSIPVANIPLSVPHNFLNLPTSFSFNAGNGIELLYDGLGTKLRRTVKTAGSVSLTQDYLGSIELKNNVVEAVYNEEGRAYNTGGSYRYEYVLRDHLGNTRLVFTDKDNSGSIDNSEILSESHYYPFGRKMDGAWYSDAGAGKYRYLYNGKELSDEFDLNFYDYGARWYDPGLGAWWEIDPLAEVSRRWSPYVFSNNNPLRFVDADGMNAADEAARALQRRVDDAQFADRATGTVGSAAQFGADDNGDPPTKRKPQQGFQNPTVSPFRFRPSTPTSTPRFLPLSPIQIAFAILAGIMQSDQNPNAPSASSYKRNAYIYREMSINPDGSFVRSPLEGAPNGRQMGVRTPASALGRQDIIPGGENNNVVGPEYTGIQGLSASNPPRPIQYKGTMQGAVQISNLPVGLEAINDHANHYSIFPVMNMTVSEYQTLLNSIPWIPQPQNNNY